MPDASQLIVSMIFSSLGMGFFIYGKKQGRLGHMLCGIVLGIFPYFVTNIGWMIGTGIVLTALPFLIN